jgi:hypothetical protein
MAMKNRVELKELKQEIVQTKIVNETKVKHSADNKIAKDPLKEFLIFHTKGIPDGRRNLLYYVISRYLIRPPDISEAVHYMDVVSISFSKQGPKMLANLYAFLQRGDIAIHPKFTTLISALQSARNVPNRNSQFILDKPSQSLDCLDALRLALFNFDAEAADFEEEDADNEEEEEENEVTV